MIAQGQKPTDGISKEKQPAGGSQIKGCGSSGETVWFKRDQKYEVLLKTT